MPKYFFNYRHGREVSHDDQGIVFDNVEAAYLSAFNGALEMWQELLRARIDPRCCAFEVVDEKDRMMFVLPFSEVLESCKRNVDTDTNADTIAGRAFVSIIEARNHARRRLTEFRDEVRVTRRMLHESRTLMAAVDQMAESLILAQPTEPAPLPLPKGKAK